jgi:hypothetical protein
MMMKLNIWDWIAFILVIIGALNWGLVGFFNWDLVMAIFGAMPMVARVIYALVGLAGVYMLFAMPMYARKTK